MDCYYINLAAARARRECIEASFRAHAPAAWQLHRFAALPIDEISVRSARGRLMDSEKSCLLSHRGVISLAAQSAGPTMIVEDDTVFGTKTFQVLDSFLGQGNDVSWDLLFTDLLPVNLSSMMSMVKSRRSFAASAQVGLLDLSDISFGCASSYIVNPRSAARMLALLDQTPVLDAPYDLVLRHWISAGTLKGHVFFPFLTSLSDASEVSQINQQGPGDTRLICNLFRKMVWIDRDFEAVKPVLSEIENQWFDQELRAFSTLFAAMASSHFALV